MHIPIEEKIKSLRVIIDKCNYDYHSGEGSDIPDYDYDMMVRELKQLEEEYPEYKTASSPTNKVGHKPANLVDESLHVQVKNINK